MYLVHLVMGLALASAAPSGIELLRPPPLLFHDLSGAVVGKYVLCH
jgi:hypothetical protein